jgi:glycosyltransferase involved in cell wall biosynthesis
MTSSQKFDTRNAVVIIDWNISGHHPTYLKEYLLAFAEGKIPAVVLSPKPPLLDPMPQFIAWREIPTIAWIKKRKKWGTSIARWRYARILLAALRNGQAALDIRCSQVFFGCFHENQSKIASSVMKAFQLPAAGLYIHAGIFHSGEYVRNTRLTRKVMGLLRQPLLQTIFMLDEDMMQTVSEFSEKKIVFLPDVTDCSIDVEDPLPTRLGLEPKTRPVIGLLGHLRPSKGVAEMVEFALSNKELDVTFLLAGSCRWEEFPPEQEALIKRAVAEDPRVVFYPEQIPDGSPYNSLVRACDLLWAVYRDCPHSSNTLSKAAVFERPVIVADGYLMARQTREYALGEVVPADNLAAMRDIIQSILDAPEDWRRHASPRWEAFRELRSNTSFRSILREWAGSRKT